MWLPLLGLFWLLGSYIKHRYPCGYFWMRVFGGAIFIAEHPFPICLDNTGSKKYLAQWYLVTSFSCTSCKMLREKLGTKVAFQPLSRPLSSKQFVQFISACPVWDLSPWVPRVEILSYLRIHLLAFEGRESLGEFLCRDYEKSPVHLWFPQPAC